jgi:hypothetical protein
MKFPTLARLFTQAQIELDLRLQRDPRLLALHRDRPIAELRALAHLVWHNAGRDPALLTVVAGDGMRRAGHYLVSYSATHNLGADRRIVLARSQRTVYVLLHEMSHALGSNREYNHGPAFRRRYHDLLVRYGGG